MSHDHKFIFQKTRKTAGTSIEMLFEPFCAPSEHVVTEHTQGYRGARGIVGHRSARLHDSEVITDWREHRPAWEVRKALGRTVWNSYFRFSAVRNPFDRAISFFHWKWSVAGNPRFENFAAEKGAFENFILSDELRSDKSVVHRKGVYLMQDAIRFEHLREDILRIATRLGLALDPAKLPVTKADTPRNKSRAVADYFSNRPVTEKVLACQDWVFQRFGYSPDPHDSVARSAPDQTTKFTQTSAKVSS